MCLGTSSYQQDHADRYTSYVLNTVLGGSMSSRLFQNIREKRGLAYAVFSGLSAYRDAGSMTIYAGCANNAVGELIDVVISELRTLQDEPLLGLGAAARQGSPQGQPDAEPGEHLEPHVSPGAAGDLLRSSVRARRDPRRRRARHDRRRKACGERSVRRRRAGSDGAGRGEWSGAATGESCHSR